MRLPFLLPSLLFLLSSNLQALDTAALAAALNAPGRDVADRVRDVVRKPVEVLDFLGVDSGMTVVDLYAAEGYFTYILAKAVGPDGVVYAQTPPRSTSGQDDRVDMTQGDALQQKISAGNLTNVVRLEMAVQDLDLPPESADFVLISQILHDYFNANPLRGQQMLEQVRELLKPGGLVGIIDHVGNPDSDNLRMHRMRKTDAVHVAEQAGFIVEADSNLLHNPADNHRRSIFDPMLQRNSDQFLLRLRKPLQ
jgi:predicted methyltransferase